MSFSLKIVAGQNAGEEYPLKPGENHIGRSRSSDIKIEDEDVSGQHFVLELKLGAIILRNISHYGTFIGDQCIWDFSIVLPGQIIGAGKKAKFKIEFNDADLDDDCYSKTDKKTVTVTKFVSILVPGESTKNCTDAFVSDYIDAFAVTDMGLVRNNNEDAVLSIPESGCFMISDGMGGGEAGEVASSMMVNEVAKLFTFLPSGCTPGEREGVLIRCAQRVNTAIHRYAKDHSFPSMGATMVSLLLNPWDPDRVALIHAGDSRAYRIRNNQIKQMTNDHAMDQNMIAENLLPKSMQGLLMNALGLGRSFFLERQLIDLKSGDFIVLCSDGLSRMVPDVALLQIYLKNSDQPAAAIAQEFLEAALDAGGKDNISIIVIRIKQLPSVYTPTENEVERDHAAYVRNQKELTAASSTETEGNSSVTDYNFAAK